MNESLRKHILLVEDDEGDADLFRALIAGDSRYHFHVTEVRSIQAARQAISGQPFDLIIMDLSLPDSQGLEGFDSIRKEFSEFPIVLMTGLDDENVAMEAVAKGAQDYLIKGEVDGKLLSKVIRYAIERKRIDSDIRAAEEKYRAVFENSAVAIMVADSSQRVVSWNRFTEELLGMTSGDLLHRPVSEIYPRQEWERIHALGLRKDSRQKDYLESRILRKDEEPLPVDISLTFLKDERGVEQGSIAFIRDITERVKLQQMKDEFISVVSHELRTPLAVIREGVSQVIDGVLGETTKKQKQFLEASLEGIDRLNSIIVDLLDLSKLEAGRVSLDWRNADWEKMTGDIERSFEPRVRETGIALEVSFSRRPVFCFADGSKVLQVLTNLVGNAMKFTEKGHVRIHIEDNENEVRCSVSDTGMGISQEDLKKVFSKFQQFSRDTAKRREGTGLGLAISKAIVELHGGKIGVESQLGAGTTFHFSIPRKTARVLFEQLLDEAVREALETRIPVTAVRFRFPPGFRAEGQPGAEHFDVWMRRQLPHHADRSIADQDEAYVLLVGRSRERAMAFAEERLGDYLALPETGQDAADIVLSAVSFPEEAEKREQMMEILLDN